LHLGAAILGEPSRERQRAPFEIEVLIHTPADAVSFLQ
jgi:hypothetical protein